MLSVEKACAIKKAGRVYIMHVPIHSSVQAMVQGTSWAGLNKGEVPQ